MFFKFFFSNPNPFTTFRDDKDIERAQNLLFSRSRWIVGEYLDELIATFSLSLPRWKVLLDFLPLVKKMRIFPRFLPGILSSIFDVEIVVSDEMPPLKNSLTKFEERKKELLEKLRNQSNSEELDNEVTREKETLQKTIEKIEKTKVPSSYVTCGLYEHSCRRIVLFPKAPGMREYALDVLAHELFHAYHANHTKSMSLSWDKIAAECEALIESLARFNEYLFLKDRNYHYSPTGMPSCLGNPASLCRRYEDEALHCHPMLWPYSGFILVKKKIEGARALGMKNEFEGPYIRSLIQRKDAKYQNSAILLDYSLIV